MTFGRRKLFLEFPLVKRELVGLLRTRRAFWLLVVTVALSGLLPLLAWPSRSEAFAASWENLWTVMTFLMAQLVVSLLTIPAFTAGAISGERERDTYDLLYSTLLSPASIIASKTLASAGYVVLLLAASAPAVCVLYLLGGVSFETLLKCYAITFAAVLSSGLVCLAQSMRSRRTAHAAVRGVLGVVFWNGGLQFLFYLGAWVFAAATGFESAMRAQWLQGLMTVGMALSPFSAMWFEVLKDTAPPSLPVFGQWTIYRLYLFYAGLISVRYLVYLLRRVRAPELALSRRRERRLARAQGLLGTKRIRRPFLGRFLIALGENEVPLLRNPVFLKEVRSEFFSRVGYRRALFWGPLAICVALGFLSTRVGAAIHSITVLSLVLIMIIVPAISASSFPREVEQGNLDFLRGTLLSLKEVLFGKLLGGVYACFGIAAAAGWSMLAAAMAGPGPDWSRRPDPLWALVSCGAVLLMTLAFTTALSTFASVVCRRSLGALLTAYLAVLALFVLWPILATFVIGGLGLGGGSVLRDVLSATHPMMALTREARPLVIFLTFYGAACILLWFASGWYLERFRAQDR